MQEPRDNRSAEMREIRELARASHWVAQYALAYALELLSARQVQWVSSATESARRQLEAAPSGYQELMRERFGG